VSRRFLRRRKKPFFFGGEGGGGGGGVTIVAAWALVSPTSSIEAGGWGDDIGGGRRCQRHLGAVDDLLLNGILGDGRRWASLRAHRLGRRQNRGLDIDGIGSLEGSIG
jgi:hypothetical protein